LIGYRTTVWPSTAGARKSGELNTIRHVGQIRLIPDTFSSIATRLFHISLCRAMLRLGEGARIVANRAFNKVNSKVMQMLGGMASSEAALVAMSVDDGVGRLRLSDPQHRNALSKRLSDDLAAAVDAAIAGGAQALVVTADPPVSGAGGSLARLLDRKEPLL